MLGQPKTRLKVNPKLRAICHVKTMVVTKMFVKDHCCQDHVCQDHGCLEHVCKTMF